MKRITIKSILKKKGVKPITCLTAYSKSISEILDNRCDIILVGDSLGMVLYGMKNTKNIKIQTMINHGRVVKRFAKKSLVVIDMPFKSYSNKSIAYKNAKKIMKETKCDGVKLEGGKKIINIVKFLVKKKIPVMGHIGLLPQSSKKFNVKGKSDFEKKKIIEDAILLSKSGVFCIVIECVVESLAKKITNLIAVPTIGIGASKYCDGQILVTDDILGLSNFAPRFVKRYSNLRKIIKKSVNNYCNDVKKRRFPFLNNIYKY